jgi:5-methylcytosine-specific restriction enzyme A
MLEWPLPVKPTVHGPPGVRSAAEVKRALDRERPSAARRGYGPRWRHARPAYLARHPLCVPCGEAGRLVPAKVVDHIVLHRGNQKLFWDEANWAAMCKPCHDAKTAREGRWG